jgi:hypothetical protein
MKLTAYISKCRADRPGNERAVIGDSGGLAYGNFAGFSWLSQLCTWNIEKT